MTGGLLSAISRTAVVVKCDRVVVILLSGQRGASVLLPACDLGELTHERVNHANNKRITVGFSQSERGRLQLPPPANKQPSTLCFNHTRTGEINQSITFNVI